MGLTAWGSSAPVVRQAGQQRRPRRLGGRVRAIHPPAAAVRSAALQIRVRRLFTPPLVRAIHPPAAALRSAALQIRVRQRLRVRRWGLGFFPSFKRPFSVAPCQTFALRFATFCVSSQRVDGNASTRCPWCCQARAVAAKSPAPPLLSSDQELGETHKSLVLSRQPRVLREGDGQQCTCVHGER